MFGYERAGKHVTQIGSLPLTDVEEAVAYSLRHEIPFLPELPLLGDSMLSYIKNPGQLSTLRAFKRHRYATIKVQAIGPATLILSGYGEDEALLRIYRHIEAILDGLVAEEVILFLDEPALGQVGFDFRRLWNLLFAGLPAVRGAHVCGNMQWDLLFSSEIDIVSFDASRYDITRYYPRNGKRIAWGISDPTQVRDLQPGDLVTPPCGLSPQAYGPQDLERVLDLLNRATRAVSAQDP
ncbi:MAG: hypothetical protein ABID40_01220 [Candidatus Bipolaricaulota bacterium]